MIERHINKINFNPFLCSLFLQSFYKGYQKESCPLNLHYLILPLILFGETRNIILKNSGNNKIYDLIQSNKLVFSDIQQRVLNMKRMTNLSLINLHANKKIILKNEVKIISTIVDSENTSAFNDRLKAAYLLGIMFQKENNVDVFKSLKVLP